MIACRKHTRRLAALVRNLCTLCVPSRSGTARYRRCDPCCRGLVLYVCGAECAQQAMYHPVWEAAFTRSLLKCGWVNLLHSMHTGLPRTIHAAGVWCCIVALDVLSMLVHNSCTLCVCVCHGWPGTLCVRGWSGTTLYLWLVSRVAWHFVCMSQLYMLLQCVCSYTVVSLLLSSDQTWMSLIAGTILVVIHV